MFERAGKPWHKKVHMMLNLYKATTVEHEAFFFVNAMHVKHEK